MIQVQSAEDARDIAYHWATSRGKDAVQIVAFAENFFKEQQGQPTSIEMLEIQLQHFSNAIGTASSAWSRYAAESWAHQTTWEIETVKHLAITNVSGIAGSAALLAGGKFFNEYPLKIAVVSFTVGLMMALLDFWLVSQGYWKRATDQDRRTRNIKKSSSWSEYVSAESKYLDKGKRWFSAAGRVGWTSAVGAIIGGITLGIAIFATAPAAVDPPQNEPSSTEQATPLQETPPAPHPVQPPQSQSTMAA